MQVILLELEVITNIKFILDTKSIGAVINEETDEILLIQETKSRVDGIYTRKSIYNYRHVEGARRLSR